LAPQRSCADASSLGTPARGNSGCGQERRIHRRICGDGRRWCGGGGGKAGCHRDTLPVKEGAGREEEEEDGGTIRRELPPSVSPRKGRGEEIIWNCNNVGRKEEGRIALQSECGPGGRWLLAWVLPEGTSTIALTTKTKKGTVSFLVLPDLHSTFVANPFHITHVQTGDCAYFLLPAPVGQSIT
jgi:hypothetical protein